MEGHGLYKLGLSYYVFELAHLTQDSNIHLVYYYNLVQLLLYTNHVTYCLPCPQPTSTLDLGLTLRFRLLHFERQPLDTREVSQHVEQQCTYE